MGDAKRRRERAAGMIYHHTSTLRTNLIWMSGVIQVEGQSEGAVHPQLGTILTDALARRALRDFPPVVWFTTRIDPPRCLIESKLIFVSKTTGQETQIDVGSDIANAVTLHRMALGFRAADIGAVPWPEYHGYSTAEGQDLNESARDAGDDPDDWYICEAPVDLMLMSEIRTSRSVTTSKLERNDAYLADVRRMVTLCREQKGVYIPPTWLSQADAERLAGHLKVEVRTLR